MKLTNGMTGVAATPDYEMLRAALVAAQAETPTARAAAQPRTAEEMIAALHALLTKADTPEADANLLGHSFARGVPEEDAGS